MKARPEKTRYYTEAESAERIADARMLTSFFATALTTKHVATDAYRRAGVLGAMAWLADDIDRTLLYTVSTSSPSTADDDLADVYAALTYSDAERWLLDRDPAGFNWTRHAQRVSGESA